MSEDISGRCLCGAVNYVVTGDPVVTGNCFCTDCRKASGTSHCTHAAFPEPQVNLTGSTKSFEKPADSGNMVTRHFCPECGSAVYSTNSGMPGMIFIRASSLDEPDRISPELTVYASRAPQWAHVDDSKPVFAEMMSAPLD